jgi:hypothetical protein
MTRPAAPEQLLPLSEIVLELVSVIGIKLTLYVTNSSDNSAVGNRHRMLYGRI